MTPDRLAQFAREHLRDILDMSGEVLYSGVATLQPGEVYLLGHNPGGDASNPRLPTVGSSLAELPTKSINSYLDTQWSGRDTLQRRVIWLLSALGLNPRAVAASNLVFARSRDAATSHFGKFAELCWPVHKEILRIVSPRLVIVYGNSGESPFAFLARKYAAQISGDFPSGHGNWVCRSFQVPGAFRVVGLPHLSRYDVTAHPQVVDWIKSVRHARVSNSQSRDRGPAPAPLEMALTTTCQFDEGDRLILARPGEWATLACPGCTAQRLYELDLKRHRNAIVCRECGTAFQTQVAVVTSKRSSRGWWQNRRQFSVQVQNSDGSEELIEFASPGAGDFELRADDTAIFSYLNDRVAVVQNMTAKRAIRISK